MLESLYHPAGAKEKFAMQVEFYGSEFVHFGAKGGTGEVKNLRDAMLQRPVMQRQGLLRQVNAALLPILVWLAPQPALIG